MEVVLPTAWLHDCASVTKDSPLRSTASELAARTAGDFPRNSGYPAGLIPDVRHALEPTASPPTSPRGPERRWWCKTPTASMPSARSTSSGA